MYIVCWVTSKGVHEVVGDYNSTISIASLLENSKQWFKVGMRGANLSQDDFGCGGFEYWLPSDANFKN